MQDHDESYDVALAEAQRLGIAETDPSLDVEGWDTASKLVLLTNALLGGNLTLNDLEVSGIEEVKPQDIRTAADSGKVLKLIARAEIADGRVIAFVRVCQLGSDHPLARVTGAEKAVTYTTDTMDKITVVGGKSDPRGAAAAILKDLINLAQEQFRSEARFAD
jgi:homoserine dehydrogenase